MMERIISGDTVSFCNDGNCVLSITESEQEGKIVMMLKGELRSDLVHDFEDELIALTTVGANICVDLQGLTYLSSTAQYSFLRVQQKMDRLHKGSLTLCNLTDDIYKEFESTGVSELLMIE